jgi:formate hydrogenlyase subunit 3/multisubunit Na+/H+ antiporter MnhD subunit
MSLLLLAMGIWLGSGLMALFFPHNSKLATGLGAWGLISGAVFAVFPVVRVLMGGAVGESRLPMSLPGGSFFVQLDPLSAWFILPMLVLLVAAAIYAMDYMAAFEGRHLGVPAFFFNLLATSMVMVVLSRNAVLFLMAWEVMSIASFFLVTFEDEKPAVREAGWVYLIATHLGTTSIFVLFVLMGREAGSMDFDKWAVMGTWPGGMAGSLFILAVIGFGTKAGFMPFHVWLPEAHPAAPSHVSAVMSGVMIKTGVYGVLRMLTYLGTPAAWWGWLLLGVGLVSGILGVINALAQHDLKRLLAYSSVENVGIMTIGMGIGLLGISMAAPAVAILGFSACLLHFANHALFKGLLFLGAGSVLHGTGTRQMDRLGGLLKKMPVTGLCFLLGVVAICGLPPMNGFIGEVVLFMAGFKAATSLELSRAIAGVAVILGMGLIGGLAVVCFTKAFGIVFLGEPRGREEQNAHESGSWMRAGMAILVCACVCASLGAPIIIQKAYEIAAGMARYDQDTAVLSLAAFSKSMYLVALVFLVLGLLIALLVWVRSRLLTGRKIESAATWGCGYVASSSRVQYTGSSFVQPVTMLYRLVLRMRTRYSGPKGYFPSHSSFLSETPDVWQRVVYGPAFGSFAAWLAKLRWLQQGQVQLYVLYMAATLLALLIWKLG